MLTQLDGSHRGEGMDMIRRGHNDRVDVFLLVQHLPVVFVLFRVRKSLERPRRLPPVHIAESHNVLARHLADVMPSLAADTDPGHVQLFAGRRAGPQSQDVLGHKHECAGAQSRPA
jgi:hypothetical protein